MRCSVHCPRPASAPKVTVVAVAVAGAIAAPYVTSILAAVMVALVALVVVGLVVLTHVLRQPAPVLCAAERPAVAPPIRSHRELPARQPLAIPARQVIPAVVLSSREGAHR